MDTIPDIINRTDKNGVPIENWAYIRHEIPIIMKKQVFSFKQLVL
jgi:hypothetical protein